MRCRCADNEWPGMVRAEQHEDGSVVWLPCPECGGCGVVSCCDSAGSAQPEISRKGGGDG